TGNINTCVIIDGTIQYFDAEPYVQRHVDIEPVTNPNNATATITLYFKDQEFVEFNNNRVGFPALPTVAGGGNADPNKANLRVTQYHGVPIAPHNNGNPAAGFYSGNAGSGVLITPTVNYNTTYNYWELTFPITGFSGFYVHTNLHFPLPISIRSFTGSRQLGGHVLNWQVNCNSNAGVSMVLERSGDGRQFTPVHSIRTDTIRCLQPFSYTDAAPLAGTNYYRLKVVSPDGKISYSSLVVLINADKGIELISIEPNPVVNGFFHLHISSARGVALDLSIVDMRGRLLRRQQVNAVNGFNSFRMEVADLASGTYMITVQAPDDKPHTLRFVKE
ncbi:MAG TPA: T9SS type A sorting domain-containing protein, partial [Ferruginibacter sp.]|nr:T9SS type A sorting domain-containing protein [Ferruginibacter sp.]